jgi:SAM-dependent methyltransferase
MENKTSDMLVEVADYYSAKLNEHGETPRGVDWNGKESQELRFRQLCNIIDKSAGFSINDLGCGYGALFDYLQMYYRDFVYNGCDVSGPMISAAQNRYVSFQNSRFTISSEPPESADYGIASGIFNVRLNCGDVEWLEHLKNTLDILDRSSRRGFAFNCLTSYSDDDKMREYLYYADPCVIFDLCKRRYSRHVALLHDYGLYEFTVLVRRDI